MGLGRSATIAAVVILGTLTGSGADASGTTFPQLEGTGSSFAGPAIDQWVAQTSSQSGLNINFQVSSSQQGLTMSAKADFGASDLTYAAGNVITPTQPYQYLPDVGGALAFMYNLVGSDGQQVKNLVLSAQTVDGIFSGAITYWDDPSISAINPPVVATNLPHVKFAPVYRQDSAGETYLLSAYLLDRDGATFQAYQHAVGDPTAGRPSAKWPTSTSSAVAGYPNYGSLTGQTGADGVANYVSALSSDGTIGYLEMSYADQHQFPVASLMNGSGHAVLPDSVNAATALEKATLKSDLSADLTGVFRDKEPNAYPLSGYSYVIAPCSPSLARAERPPTRCSGDNSGTSGYPADKGAELAQFLNFAVCQGQERMGLLGYTILPRRLVAQAFSAISRINGAVEPRSPSAKNCPNPYVDGQLHLP